VADNSTIARPYAQAIFEVAESDGMLGEWAETLSTAGQLLADRGLIEYLGNPHYNDEQRFEFLTGLFANAGSTLLSGDDKKGSNLLRLLLENDRLAVLPEISGHFDELKAKVENVVDAVVTSASRLSDEQTAEIARSLKERLGRDVKITTEIDENLIGGAVIRAGDVVIDGSLRARLDGLANALIK